MKKTNEFTVKVQTNNELTDEQIEALIDKMFFSDEKIFCTSLPETADVASMNSTVVIARVSIIKIPANIQKAVPDKKIHRLHGILSFVAAAQSLSAGRQDLRMKSSRCR